jgi:hypothetical protein
MGLLRSLADIAARNFPSSSVSRLPMRLYFEEEVGFLIFQM